MCNVLPSISATSRFRRLDDGLNDRGVINLPSLCNIGQLEEVEENKIAFNFDFEVHQTSGFPNGTDIWVSAGVRYSRYNMWVGQLKAVVRTDLSNSVSINSCDYILVVF